jgi:hypothetical protein
VLHQRPPNACEIAESDARRPVIVVVAIGMSMGDDVYVRSLEQHPGSTEEVGSYRTSSGRAHRPVDWRPSREQELRVAGGQSDACPTGVPKLQQSYAARSMSCPRCVYRQHTRHRPDMLQPVFSKQRQSVEKVGQDHEILEHLIRRRHLARLRRSHPFGDELQSMAEEWMRHRLDKLPALTVPDLDHPTATVKHDGWVAELPQRPGSDKLLA